ncbi:ABC transporter permease [Nesterenkonia populi]|uniref:ABC transporter permease n=1 Tax=Nesterenkonia populi TaxID=1591087 RepID=UPI0011BEE0CC|nr:ABC transporter permease [Nesterenkonia populi]
MSAPLTETGRSTTPKAAGKDRLARAAATRGVLHMAERTLRSMRAYAGVILFASIANPIIYIAAMGLGLGVLIGEGTSFAEYGAESYLMYIAPAILASTLVMSGAIEMTFPVMEGFKWRRTYYAAQATPLTPRQIAAGHILAVCVRFLIHSSVFLTVMLLFGVISSPWAFLQIITASMGGLALGLPIMAYVAALRDDRGRIALIQRFVVMPLFLFSGTFYPLTNLPLGLQVLGWLSPIWHANELGRVLSFGQPTPAWLIGVHVGYLLLVIVAGWLIVQRIYTARLGYAEWRGRVPGARAEAKRKAKLSAQERRQDISDGAMPSVVVRTGFASNLYSGNIRAVFERGLSAIRSGRKLIFFAGFLEPVLFLTSFGLGVSPMLDDGFEVSGETVAYAAFIAPALLAVSAMNGAVFDSTVNVFFKLRLTKLYRTMMATSLGPLDLALGEILLALLRGGIYAAGFLAVLLSAGLVDPAAAVLMLAAALLIALGFASAGMAITTFMTRFQQLDWLMVLMLPMFLFSATLFPIEVYPEVAQRIIQVLPLWHGVELMRHIAFWDFSLMSLVHIGYYLVMVAVGMTVTTYRMRRLFLR